MAKSAPIVPILTFAAGAGMASLAWVAAGGVDAPPRAAADAECSQAAGAAAPVRAASVPAAERLREARARAVGGGADESRPSARAERPAADDCACDCPDTSHAWPDGVPEAYLEAAFRESFTASLAAAAPDVGFEIDCTEFPCLASITDRRLDPEERTRLRQQLLEHHYPDAENSWTRRNAVGPGGHSQAEVIGVFPEGLDDDALRESLQRRVAVLVDRARAAVAEDE